eukprot:12064911-Ditylum_brightwellii.AAC.1
MFQELVALTGDPDYIRITPFIREALQDWKVIIQYMQCHPTSVRQLVKDYPAFIGYTDAYFLGGGGVRSAGLDSMQPLVWQLEWPPEVNNRIHSISNPDGNLYINDLELAGLVLG